MGQLEIKHLGRRLPYGFALYCTFSNTCRKKVDLEILAWFLAKPRENYKIPLRPLIDITREITHNGEKFIPIEKLYKERDCDAEYDFLYALEDDWASADEKIAFANYSIIEKLLEWQFRIDEPEGTWIDVNTLPKNPYE